MMKNKGILIGSSVAAMLGMIWLVFGNESFKAQPNFKDETEARSYLRSQVASGQMSEVEAQVRLAEIIAGQNQARRKGGKKKRASGKNQLFDSLMEAVDRGEMTKEEAMEQFKNRKAAEKDSGKASSQKKQ
jgi:hypothetical protein